MCGIAGFFATRAVATFTSEAMQAALRQRGPDAAHRVGWDAQFVRSDGAAHNALLHARLSVIDPRPIADQPMVNENGDIWIVYNGEVYGWAEDAAELKNNGAVFHTHSDTEFILKAYEAWGFDQLLQRLRGMFALAILDLRLGKVFLARDRLGEKPLLYSHIDGELAFGSLVRAVLPFVPKGQRQFDPAAIDAYLAHRYIPAPRTVFTHIQRLENGHCLEFDLSTRSLSKRRYWSPQATQKPWLESLDESVRMRTVADRPVGVFLSGGIDSTVIASRLASQQLTQFGTFTAAFPGSGMDESALARDTAERLAFPNQAVPIPQHLADDFERIVADLDQPFADPSSFPTWYLAREVSKQVTVVLVGDGGDELLAGYKRIPKHLRTAWRAGLRLPLPIRPTLDGKGLGKFATELAMDWLSAYSLRFSGLVPGQRRFLQPDLPAQPLCHWRAPDWQASEPVERLLALDLANTLPDYILQKSDLCTMAHGLEARAPMVDHQFYQSLLSIPAEQRYTRPAKQLLAPALDARLPDDLFARKKRGFNPPLAQWLRGDLAPRLDGLGARLASVTGGQLEQQAVERFARAYQNGAESLAEQLLQLLILDASLAQLTRLAREV